jgi:hypothetical protein
MSQSAPMIKMKLEGNFSLWNVDFMSLENAPRQQN